MFGVLLGFALLATVLWLLADRLIRPVLYSTSEDEKVTELADTDDDAGAWVTRIGNAGLGPAIVTRVRYELGIGGMEEPMVFDTCPKMLEHLDAMLGVKDDRDYTLDNLTPGAHIGAHADMSFAAVAMPTAHRLHLLTVTLTCRSVLTPFRVTKVIHCVPPRMPVDPTRRALPAPCPRASTSA